MKLSTRIAGDDPKVPVQVTLTSSSAVVPVAIVPVKRAPCHVIDDVALGVSVQTELIQVTSLHVAPAEVPIAKASKVYVPPLQTFTV